MLIRLFVCVFLGWIAIGCAALRGGDEIRPTTSGPDTDAGEEAVMAMLLPVDALVGDRSMQQRVTVRWNGREESFDSVFQKRQGELLLVGLGPMNTVGFTLKLDQVGLKFENRSGRAIPFRPEHILADVQRVFYPWLEATPACQACERRGMKNGLEVYERIGDVTLEERRFRDPIRPSRGEVVIRYEDWMTDPPVPKRAVLDNGWFGYELTIETWSVDRLE